jgi:hypothetical protein
MNVATLRSSGSGLSLIGRSETDTGRCCASAFDAPVEERRQCPMPHQIGAFDTWVFFR